MGRVRDARRLTASSRTVHVRALPGISRCLRRRAGPAGMALAKALDSANARAALPTKWV